MKTSRAPSLICILLALLIVTPPGLADDWPQWLGPRRDGVWRETGIVESWPSDGPPVRWRTTIGAGYAGPAVADDRVYVTDRRLKTGASNPSNPFQRGVIPGTERVLCLDAETGRILWELEYDCPYSVSYPAGPRATPLVDGDRVYTLGTEGHLYCLKTSDGSEVWSRQFKKDYGIETPLWGFAAHPLLDGEQLICLAGGDGTTIVSFDKSTGRERWRALSAKEPGYCPPMIYTAAGKRQLIVWHPEAVQSLNPETGEVYWTLPWEIRSALTVPTPRLSGENLFFTCFYNGSRMFRLTEEEPGYETLWATTKPSEKDTVYLHSIMSTPFIENGHIYGVCSYGQLRCLNAETGERVWETFAATTEGEPVRWANVFLVKHEDRFILANEKGELILARLSPRGYEEISRSNLLEPTNSAAGRDVVWSHPAFAHRSVYMRNDREIIRVSLGAN